MTVNHEVNVSITILGLEWLEPLLARINWRLDKMADTLEARFSAIGSKLDEASAEILAEIETLKSQPLTLTPEQEAALANIEAKANALADIAPALPPAPAPES